MIVLVESHSEERASRSQPPVPDAGGARWGRASRFAFDRSAKDAEMEDRGGITLVWPAERLETVRVQVLSPVWRRLDVIRVPSSDDPATTEEASVTRELLIPLGASRQKYLGGGTGYVEDPDDRPYEDRVIHTFLHLRLPPPLPDAEVVRVAEEGAWPDLPTELHVPGTYVSVPPLPGAWDR